MVLADMLMFLLGRYTGWWLLGMLCRLSLNPESCILRSADSFHRRGRMMLVFAKFVPGINTMAPPLAGSMNMRAGQFLRLDFAGAALYVGSYMGIGFVFSDAAEAVTRGYQLFGRVLNGIVVAAIVWYVGFQIWAWSKARVWRTVPFVRPAEAARAMLSNDAVIYDVRATGYPNQRRRGFKARRALAERRPSARRRFPNRWQIFSRTCLPKHQRPVALRRERGVHPVITGGLQAWKKAGLPTGACRSKKW